MDMTLGREIQDVSRSAVSDVGALVEALGARSGVVVLSGAGISTESGIPDYRSPEAQKRVRRPIHGPEFVRSPALRRRYWARAMVGWERFRLARPNAAHVALAELEKHGVVSGLITQNVDRLHQLGGSQRVIELHGALAEVVCLECSAMEDRDAVQARLVALNPRIEDDHVSIAPDGDADLPSELVERFVVPGCASCGGVLKPNVVFFGHNVARPIVERAFRWVDEASALLVVGTSLAVFSGYRFLLRAHERGIPIVIVNRGEVRGEAHARVKIEGSTGDVLVRLRDALLRA